MKTMVMVKMMMHGNIHMSKTISYDIFSDFSIWLFVENKVRHSRLHCPAGGEIAQDGAENPDDTDTFGGKGFFPAGLRRRKASLIFPENGATR
ncbi:MAG: hypothetical protein ACRESR_02530 [Gammaproteobacteria bacterium]